MLNGSRQETFSLHYDFYPILPRVAHLIEKALERGSQHTMMSVFKGLTQGKMQLWTYGEKVALVTALVGENCLLLACAGYNSDEWLHFLDVVREWAKDHDCKYLKIHGRKGWSRKLGFTIEGTDELGLTVMRQGL